MEDDDDEPTVNECPHCEREMPEGCRHRYGDQAECPLGPRTDIAWKIGAAIWKDLANRSGIKHALGRCDDEIQAEIIETMGNIALRVIKEHNPAPTPP